MPVPVPAPVPGRGPGRDGSRGRPHDDDPARGADLRGGGRRAGRGLDGAVMVVVAFVVVFGVAFGRARSSAGTVIAMVADVTGGAGDVTFGVGTMVAARSGRNWSRPIGPAITATARIPKAATKTALSPSLSKAVFGRVEENKVSPLSEIPLDQAVQRLQEVSESRVRDL